MHAKGGGDVKTKHEYPRGNNSRLHDACIMYVRKALQRGYCRILDVEVA